MPTLRSRVRQVMTSTHRHRRSDWWAYFGSFGDDILFEDADEN